MYLKDLVKEEKRPEPTRPVAEVRSALPTGSSIPTGARWVVVTSRLLDREKLLIVYEKKHFKEAKNEHPGKVIYFPPEIDELRRHKRTPGFPQFLRRVHLVKKTFGGWVVPSTAQKGGDGCGTATCRKRTA